jgi:hypothetical protein
MGSEARAEIGAARSLSGYGRGAWRYPDAVYIAAQENRTIPQRRANAETKDMVGVDYSTNILAYSALSENGRAIRSQKMQKLLLGYRDNMRVEVETGVAVTAKTVADLRALTAWPDGLALNIHVDLDPRFSVVKVKRAS